ncbi:uncharacterized protein N7473_004436 [Penicillium subrubescens]|uniref:uncharacterized protein n=1 Tax=Penicillium subrubescens TaxID=1316194 RepID=UPI002544D37D|nr:uncharacterized protein N7473_004436 [Penicillium subrubescens]KAJ5900366.1 hypothetical protein N7473_004436 [Penicillium subrubescens]
MATLSLLRGNEISLEDALTDDDNILHRLDYPQKQQAFCSYLLDHKADIESLVSFHLGVNLCEIADQVDWLFGSYNVCIPVYVNRPSGKRVLFRIPLPFKVGEEAHPGNSDEKLRCEVATYIWIRENCPTIPIPFLHGFAFLNGQTFIHEQSMDVCTRWFHRMKRTLRSLLGYPKTCPFIGTKGSGAFRIGYMIISFVESGSMLSNTLSKFLLTDKTRRQALFSDLAKIMLTLNQNEFSRIGSLTLDDDGLIHLKNRPLTLRLQTFENEGIPTIPRNSTYQCVEPYILDLLQCHDNRLHYQPNAIHDLQDGQEQLAALTMMRSLLPRFTSRQYRDGPFLLTLTDLHPSNIFVDEDWHITCLIDLEWACTFPIELQTPPYWLTGRPIDDIEHGEHLQNFQSVISEFIEAFEQQEKSARTVVTSQAEIMGKCWDRGSFWYFQAVHSPKGLLRVFNEHIQRIFCEEHCTQRIFDRTVSPYWSVDAGNFIRAKVEEDADYKDRLRTRFDEIGH